MTEYLPRLWASVFDGDLEPLVAIVKNTRIYEYIRMAVAKAIGILYLSGDLSRETVTGIFRQLIDSPALRGTWSVISDLVYLAGELHLTDLHSQIKETYRAKLVDRRECPLSQINLFFSLSEKQVLDRYRENWHHTKVDDVVEEMEWWAAFNNG